MNVKSNNTNWLINNKLNLPESSLQRIPELLSLADLTRVKSASPLNSGFHVGAVAIYQTSNGEGLARGSNSERGGGRDQAIDDAIHAEDGTISNMLDLGGSGARLKLIAITTDAPAPATSCGRCRGAVETYSESEETVIVSGGTTGDVEMWTIAELLPIKFSLSVNVSDLSLEDQNLVRASKAVSFYSFQPFTEKILGKCGASIRPTDSDSIHSGCRLDSSAFYGMPAITSAMGTFFMNEESAKFDTVALYSKTGIPTGEERQELYDKCSALGCEGSAKILLVSSETDLVQITTPRELLPFPFGAGDIGIRIQR